MIDQGTSEWFAQRTGKVTASRMADVIGKAKTGKTYLKAREDYKVELVCELLTGLGIPQFSSAATAWGTEQEAHAIAEYQIVKGNIIEPAPFIVNADLDCAGGSPDGLITAEGLAEVKCPYNPVNHMAVLLSQKMPPEHMPQVQANLWHSKRQWCDFISFDPRMPEHLRIFIERIPRDEEYIAMLEQETISFWAEVSELRLKLEAV